MLRTALMLFIAACTLIEPRAAAATAALHDDEWRLIGRDPDQHHFSPLHQIDASNVGKLALAWYADMPVKDGMVGVPLVAAGKVFQSGPLGTAFANDVRTGKLLWSFDAHIGFPMNVISSWGARMSRGLALWKDSVIMATGDCRLIALDMNSGAKRWEAQACDPTQYKTITGAPRVGGGKVFIGNSNGDTGIGRGHVDAFDAATGKHLWRFYTIPGDPAKGFENKAMEVASKTWGKEYWKGTGGGSAWDAITYDEKLNLVYIGVDSPVPAVPTRRGEGRGDELYTNSIVALKADTGEYVWHYQVTPDDAWNYSAAMHIMIAELPIDGKPRRVILQAPKNGFFYVLDAKTGRLLSANNFVPVNWASHIDLKTGRPVQLPDAKYWLKGPQGALLMPSPLGAHAWQPMSYSPLTGLVYIPAMQMPTRVRLGSNLVGAAEVDWYTSVGDPKNFKGTLIAWDPLTQKERWHHDGGAPYNGGVLSTAGNLVFEGTTTGTFNAYRADDGQKLWTTYTGGSGVFAAPSTVEIDGEQLILLPVGSGTTSAVGIMPLTGAGPGGAARLLAFKLNGKVSLPPSPHELEALPQPPRPRPPAELAQKGLRVWNDNGCEVCHGYAVIGGHGSVPDLRRATANTHDLFAAIVLGGLRKDKGMPIFAETIDAEGLAALQAYILEAAWKSYDAQQAKK